jgi:predicted negative regulator of RcsB-dependent stress response
MEEQQESSFYKSLVDFTEKNKKKLVIAGAAILLLAAGLTLYNKYVLEPKNKESVELLAKIQEYFRQDSFALVVNGGLGYKSAVEISSSYSSTKAGNLANYYAGVSYLKLGEYDNAIKYLKKFDPNGDKIIGSFALSCMGDAYVEKSDFNEALKYYQKALNYTTNELTTPVHARKVLNVLIEQNKLEEALTLIDKMLNDEKLPDSFKYELRKYKGFVEAKSGKLSE